MNEETFGQTLDFIGNTPYHDFNDGISLLVLDGWQENPINVAKNLHENKTTLLNRKSITSVKTLLKVEKDHLLKIH